ncbi:hypothetical protein CRG98_035130 [Punica granatum]|uniref:Uncharacterized protein n=1 Tax=Punica granatum TaxID=22663 RepID=A0A2I0IKF7_PUNGR|nr:hypothetical protein CRG98_035130 [Punica granatum]
MLRKFAEPTGSCFLRPCWVCSPVLVYFHALQVRRASSLVLLASLPGLLARASLLSWFASSPSLLARASCDLGGSTHPCEFTFFLRKFAEPSGSCFFRPCQVCSLLLVYFHALQFRRACSFVFLATLPGLLTLRRACSLFLLTTLPSVLTHASLLSFIGSSPSLLARTFCDLAGSAHPCEFPFMLRKLAEPAGSSFLRPYRVCSPGLVYFHASQLGRACCLVPLATLLDLLPRASLLSCFASSPSLLPRASCNLAPSADPCGFTFMLGKLDEPARSFFLQPCRVCSPMRVYFHSSEVRRACWLVHFATLPGLLTRASVLSFFTSSPSLLDRASCDLAGSAHPCECTFILHKFAESARSCFLRPCRVCSPVRVSFHASQVSRACWLVILATLPGLLTRASLLSCFATWPSLLSRASCDLVGSAPPLLGLLTRASLLSFFTGSTSLLDRASCDLAGSAHPCECTFILHKFAESARSCFLRLCRVCSPVRVYFHASQVRRACWLVPLGTLSGLLTRASLLSCFASSPCLLAHASCHHVGSAHSCEFTFMLRKFAEPARSCLLQPYLVYSPVRVYYRASQVRPACWLMPLANLPGLINLASLLSFFASSLSLLAHASCNLAESAHPCEFTFLLCKFADPAPTCYLQLCRVDLPVRVFFHASQVRRTCSLVLLATLPGSAHPCEFTFILREFAEPACSCFLPPCRVCSPPSLLARPSCDLTEFAHPCELAFMLRKLAEPAGSSLFRPYQVCPPVRAYFHASQVRRACWLVPLCTLPDLLTRASLLSSFASSPSLLARTFATLPGLLIHASLLACFGISPSLFARASCNLAGSAHPCEFTFMLLQVPRSYSAVLLATLPGLLTRASLLSFYGSSPSLLPRASCHRAGSAHLCDFTLMLRNFVEHAGSCFLLPCRICSPVRAYFHASQLAEPAGSSLLRLYRVCSPVRASFHASQVRRACSLVLLRPCRVCSPVRVYFHASQVRRACSLVLLRPCRVCSPVRVYFHASQVSRACWLVPLATLPGLLTRASFLSCLASSPSLLARAFATLPGLLTHASFLSCFVSSPSLLARSTCNPAGSPHPCELTFMLRKLAEPAGSFYLQPCRVSSSMRAYFHASEFHRAYSLVLLATLPGLLTRASLLSCFASSPSLLGRATCNHAGSSHLWDFSFMLRKFTEAARSCFLRPCRVCSPVPVYFHSSEVRRACYLVHLATLPGLLTRASLLSCFAIRRACSLILLVTLPSLLTRASLLSFFASSPSLLDRSSCDLAGSAHPCNFILMLFNFVEHAGSCFLLPCRVCSPVQFYFDAFQFRRACWLVLLATLPGLLTRASLLSFFASSPSLLDRSSCDLAGSAHPCEFTFMLRKFVEPAGSCLLRPCQVCSPVLVYFHVSQVPRACSLLLLATKPGLLIRANLLSCFAISPSLLARASCHLVGSAHLCEFTFMFRMFPFPAGSCLLLTCQVCSAVLVYFHASQVRRACSLVLLATSPRLLTRTSLLSCFASSPSLLPRASCNLAASAHSHEFTFMLRKFIEPARSCHLQPCRVCLPVRVYFHPSQVRRAFWLVLVATLPGLLTSASLLSCFVSSPNVLARTSCHVAGSARLWEFTFTFSKFAKPAPPCEFTFELRKFAESARSCFLRPYRVCSPVLLSCFGISPSPLARASCNLAGSAHPCELTFMLRKFAEPTRSLFWRPCRGLITRANFLSCFACSPILLARAICNPAGSPQPCELTFMLRNFAEPTRSCFLQPCWVCSSVRVYFHALQVPRACSVVLLATLPGFLTRAGLLSWFASSPILLARGSCNLAGFSHPCGFTFMVRKFADPSRSWFLQPCRVCFPMRIYFHASQVRRSFSLVVLATLPSLLPHANLLSCFASSPSLLARVSYDLGGSAHPCEFTFFLPKFAEPAGSCFFRPCRVYSPELVYFHALQVRRACWLVLLATVPGLLARASLLSCFTCSTSLLDRASCHRAGSAPSCDFTLMLREFAEPAGSCVLLPCWVCTPVRAYFHASQVHQACSLVLLATLPGLLTRASLLSCFASSPSLLARASCDLTGSAHPCELTFMLRKFTKPARSCFLRPYRVCSPVRAYFHASQVHQACSLVLLATLPGLLTRASLLSCFASSPSLLARASCDLTGSAHPCELTFMLRKFAEPAGSCFLPPCRVCSLVRFYFDASRVRRACWLVVHLATLPGLLTRASLLSCFASSPSLLARASCDLTGSAHPCELTFMLRKFAEPTRSCFCVLAGSNHRSEFSIMLPMFADLAGSCCLQPCRVSSPMLAYFHASEFRRAHSLVLLATLPGLLTRASLLSCFFKFPWPCYLQPCRVFSPVRVYFHAPQVHRGCSLVLLATMPGLLTCASLLSFFGSSPSLLARTSCDPAESAHPCEFTFMLCKLAEHAGSSLLRPYWLDEPARSFFLQPCRVCSPVQVTFILRKFAESARSCFLRPSRVCSPVSPSLLARVSCKLAGSAHPCEFTFMLGKFHEPARLCYLQPCRVFSPVKVYFHASQVHRGCSLVLLATLPGLLTRASLLSFFGSLPSLLARTSCDLAGSAHPCEFTFMLRKSAEPAGSSLLRPYRVCSPGLVYFHASQLDRACCLMPLATLLCLLTRPSLLSCFASSPSLLARASCQLAGSAHPCEFTLMLRKFTEPAGSSYLQPCPVCSPVRAYFHASQVHRASSLVLLTTLPRLLTRASLLSSFASSPSLLALASSHHAGRACCLVPLATLPGLLTRASFLSCLASSPSLLALASSHHAGSAHPCELPFMPRKFAEPARLCFCDLAGSAHSCEFSFMLRKFAEPAGSFYLQPCRVSSSMRAYFHASQVSRARCLVPLATLPGLLTRASFLSCLASSPSLLARSTCNPAGSPHPCELTFMLRNLTEPTRSCFLQPFMVCKFPELARMCYSQPCRVFSPVGL